MKSGLEQLFGRGFNFQFRIDDLDRRAAKLAVVNWFLPPLEEKRYRVGRGQIIVRLFAAHDPDGYIVRFSQGIATQDLCTGFDRLPRIFILAARGPDGGGFESPRMDGFVGLPDIRR